jgi:preprotein translocase subunit SecG
MAVFLSTLFIIICVLLIIVVLLQKGRGGGIGGALGGGMGSSAFGTRTGDVFTWVTIVLTGLFLLLAIITQLVFRPPTQAVEMPAFSPVAGPIDRETSVSLLKQTAGAKIFYTTDGTEPTEKSDEYVKEPVVVQPDGIIRAITVFRGRHSEIASSQYPKTAAATRPSRRSQTMPGGATAPVEAPATAAPAPAANMPAAAPVAPPRPATRTTTQPATAAVGG